jgi:hypothetical protein
MNLFNSIAALACLAAFGGCAATTTPQTDAHLGETMTMLKAQQTLNPDASRNTDPVTGLDGKAAKGALDNYRDSFRKPPAEGSNMVTIGVGTGSGGAR